MPYPTMITGFDSVSNSQALNFDLDPELKSRHERAIDLATFGAPAAIAGFADTFLTSVGVLEDEELGQALQSTFGEFGDFYVRNREAARTVGDLTGMFIPGLLATKVFRTGSVLFNALEKGGKRSRLLRSAFSSGQTYERLLRPVRARDAYLARRGVKDFLSDSVRKRMVQRSLTRSISDVFKETVAFEMGVLATMNTSDVLYPDEFSTVELLALNALFPSAAGIAQNMFLKRAIRASAQRPELAEIANAVRNPANLTQSLSRPGLRDLEVTNQAITRSALAQSAQETGDRTKLSVLLSERDASGVAIRKGIERMGTDVPIKDLTRKTSLSDAEIKSTQNALERDELAVLGGYSIENIRDPNFNYDAFRKDLLDKTKSDIIDLGLKQVKLEDAGKVLSEKDSVKLQKLQERRDALEQAQFFIIEQDGSVVNAATRRSRYQDGDRSGVKFNAATTTKPAIAEIRTGEELGSSRGSRTFGFDSELNAIIPPSSKKKLDADQAGTANTAFLDLAENPFQVSALYDAAQRVIRSYKPGRNPGPIVISKNSHFTKVDSFLELHARTNGGILKDSQLIDGIKNVDELEYLSLQSKYKAYRTIRRRIEAQSKSPIKIRDSLRLKMDDLSDTLNLPKTSTGEVHPVLKVFEDIYQQGDKDLLEALPTFEHFKRQTQEGVFFPEVTQFLNKDIAYRGNMMNIPLDAKPALMVKRPTDVGTYSRDKLVEESTRQRAWVLDTMSRADQEGANLVGAVWKTAQEQAPTLEIARNVQGIAEGQQKGVGFIGTQQRSRGENPTMQAIQTFEELTDKEFRTRTARIFGEVLNPHTAALKQPGSRADLQSFALYRNARLQGWELEAETVALENGLFGFKLKDVKHNRDRMRQLYGLDELPEDRMMPAPTAFKEGGTQTYQPLAITELALNAATAYRNVGEITLRNTNFIKKLFGQGATRYKEWWIPPPDLSRNSTVFIVRPDEHVVSVVRGPNLQSARQRAEQELSARNEQGLVIRTNKDVDRYFGAKDQVFERFADFTDPLNQRGRAKGTSATGLIDTGPEIIDDMTRTLEKQMESILRRSRQTLLENEITYARRMYNTVEPDSSKIGGSIWQQYLAATFGNPTINPNEIVGRTNFAIESHYDDIMEALYMKVIGPSRNVKNYFTGADKKNFDALQKQLGDFNPFRDSVDFAERTSRLETPPTMKKNMGQLNGLASLLTLRLFEVGHSILTLTSLGATVPGVVKALKRHELEDAAQHAARIGAFGVQVGADNAMFSPTRAITAAMHDIFTKEFREKIWSKSNPNSAYNRGFLNQQVAEIFDTLTAPTLGYVEGLIAKHGRITTALSDNSEIAARGIAFSVGYSIAKRGLGIGDDNLAFAFAHRLANETIGNYSPNNRPRIFQGAAGMPLGLFMTFMWNYYERIFGYIGNKQTRALATQFATQAAVFGGQTVPGFQQFSDFFASNYDGSQNLVDGLRNTFGDATADAILYGSLSNLPKLFGAEDGVALYTRGDVNFRNIPTIFTIGDTPVFSMFKDFYNGLDRAVESVKTNRGFNSQQMAEILSNYSTNRFARNVGSLMSGVVTDRRGQVVGERDTITEVLTGQIENEIGLFASLAGMRTLNEAQKVETHFRIRSGELSRADRTRQLRDAFRANVRAGDLDQETINQLFADYVKNRGTAQGFSRFFSNNIMAAQTDKSILKAMELLSNERRSFDVQRLMSVIGPQSDNDPEFVE